MEGKPGYQGGIIRVGKRMTCLLSVTGGKSSPARSGWVWLGIALQGKARFCFEFRGACAPRPPFAGGDAAGGGFLKKSSARVARKTKELNGREK